MKNLKSIIVCLTVLMLMCFTMTGCGGKSDEEKLEELNKKMENAESFEKIEAIAKQIEKLEEKIKKNVKTTKLELGKPITYWQNQKEYGSPIEKVSEFKVTFKNPVIKDVPPYSSMNSFFARKGEKYFGIEVDIKNLGPRESVIRYEMEVKVDKGSIYELSGRIADKIRDDFLKADEAGVLQLWCQIPEDTYPIEVYGELGGALHYWEETYSLKFSLNLTQFKE